MTTTATPPGRIAAHPVERAVIAMHAQLDGLAETSTWSMSPAELGDTLLAVTRLRARITALELRMVVGCERADVKAADASTSTAVWWANQTRQTKPQTISLTRLAKALDWDREPVGDALAAGDLTVEQAQVIVAAVRALETGPAKDLVAPAVVLLAQAELVRLARTHDADALRVLGRRILDIVAPEVGEAYEARLLAKQEQDATDAARFSMRQDGAGRAFGRFVLPSHTAAMLKKQLFSLLTVVKTTPVGTEPPSGPSRSRSRSRPKMPSRTRSRSPARGGWGRRSRHGSSATPPTICPRAVACRRPWRSPSISTP